MSSFTISRKLFVGIGVLVALTLTLGITALLSIAGIQTRLDEISGPLGQKKSLAQDTARQSAEVTGLMRGLIIRGVNNDTEGVARNLRDIDKNMRATQATLDSLTSLLNSPESKSSGADLKGDLEELAPAGEEIAKLLHSGDIPGAVNVLDSKVRPTQQKMDEATASLVKITDGQLKHAGEEAASAAVTSRWLTALILALSCVVAIALLFVVRGIAQVLASSVVELAAATEQIAAAAGEVSASSQSLAQSSSEQAATIEETSSASTEINAMAQRATSDSRETAEIVTHSQEGIAAANQSLEEMVNAMQDIESSSQKISKIIKVIDEIAFQTNILALNAAVEAARAGQAGMGFSVVADEVRNLAQRCSQAASDTAALIDDSIQKSVGGKLKVDRVAEEIRSVTTESGRIKSLVDQINQGSVEQSRGIDQINSAMHQMEQTTQSSAAGAEQTAAAAQQLHAQASSMKQVVDRLRALVQSGPAHGTLPPVTRRAGSSSPRPKITATLRSVVKFPQSSAAKKPAPAPVNAGFPMDDDFQEL